MPSRPVHATGLSALAPVRSRSVEDTYPQWGLTLSHGHIIAAVRSPDALTAAAGAPTETVYLLCGNPLNIRDMLKSMRDCGKLVLVNLDLLAGFSRDSINVEFLAGCGASGIVSTHSDVLRAAHRHGLITVQRTFALDSAAVEAGLRATSQFTPDALEILPAVAAPRVASRFRKVHPSLRIVAGGLISDLKEVESVLATGIDAVSVSDSRFWIA
jgi:glycerol uptake operon antiterminator